MTGTDRAVRGFLRDMQQQKIDPVEIYNRSEGFFLRGQMNEDDYINCLDSAHSGGAIEDTEYVRLVLQHDPFFSQEVLLPGDVVGKTSQLKGLKALRVLKNTGRAYPHHVRCNGDVEINFSLGTRDLRQPWMSFFLESRMGYDDDGEYVPQWTASLRSRHPRQGIEMVAEPIYAQFPQSKLDVRMMGPTSQRRILYVWSRIKEEELKL